MTTAAAPAARRDTAALAGLCLAGCTMLALAVLAPWIVRALGYVVLMPALAASGLVTIHAMRCAARVPARTGLVIVLGFALAMRLALVGVDPLMSTDIYRYVWDGRVQAAGINPYLYVPADPALSALRDGAIYPFISRADYAVTGYPPLAEMFFLLVTRVSESLTGMRLAMVGCEAVIVVVLIALLRRFGRPDATVVAYAWHPLAVFEIANNGHVEALMVALMMLGVWLLLGARAVAGAFVIGLSAVVKPYAVFVLPAFWRASFRQSWDWRAPLAAIAAVVICYLPYLGAGKGVLGFLGGGYLAEEGLLGGEGIWLVMLIQRVFGAVPGLAPVYATVAAVTMTVLGFVIALRRKWTPQQRVGDIVLLLTAGLFLLSPNYAWYLLALVPFLALGSGAPVWALTLAAFFLYRPLFLPENDLVWKSLATLPFVIALAACRGRLMRTGEA